MFVCALTTEETETKNSRIEALLALIARGDTAAVGRLYDLIKTDVFAYALSKTGNKQDADDIMQDTFVKIFKFAKQYTPKGKPMAWIITIELNLIRRHFQVNARTVSLEGQYERAFMNESPEQSVINNAFLKELLLRLNEDEREVISLHIVSGMKHREIAKVLGKPLSTVVSKYNRAIKKLQLVVKEERNA